MKRTTVGHVDDPEWDLYVGRAFPRRGLKASPFANPFKITSTVSRAQAIEQYKRYLHSRPDLMAQIPTLKGLRLSCWCHHFDPPRGGYAGSEVACHGDYLAELANALPDEEDA